MHIAKIIAVPAIALAAGLSLAACGSNSGSSSAQQPNAFSSSDAASTTLSKATPLRQGSSTVTLAAGTRVTPVCQTSYWQQEEYIFSVMVDSGSYNNTAGTITVWVGAGQLLAPWNALPECPAPNN
jgi:hypothetical protein